MPLTEDAINEDVARKLGWKMRFGKCLRPYDEGSGGGLAIMEVNGWEDPKKQDKRYLQLSPPDFCRSIEAAWEIVDTFGVMWLSKSEVMDNAWMCKLGKDPKSANATSYIAPMAICLAFLKLKGE